MATLLFSSLFPSASSSSPKTILYRPKSSLSITATASEPPPSIQTFWRWLSDNGVISGKCPVQPAIVPEGIGLVAKRSIGRNEVVLEIPNRYWVNPDMVAGSEIGGVCGVLKPWVSVALFLIRERKLGGESSWGDYVGILPEFTDSTVFWWVSF